MTPIRLGLLGGFRLCGQDGRDIPLPTRKCRLALVYLAVPAGRPCSREHLAAVLWAERGEEQARASLRNTLSSLRKALGPGAIVVDQDTVALRPGAVEIDVEHFECAAAQATTEALAKAAVLYRGDLLDGVAAGDSAFADWLASERMRLREAAVRSMAALADRQRADGDLEAATATALRVLELDPLLESRHRELMRLFAATGQRSRALRQYETLRRRLAEELDVGPDPETTALAAEVRRLRAEDFRRMLGGGAAVPASVRSPASAAPPPEDDAAAWPAPPENRPSIAVLPFDNLSGDPAQEYFADGVVEEVTAALSRVPSFFVIARHSAFAFKGRAMDVKEIARRLGVRYVLQGSVRRAGQRVRLGAQVVEAETGAQLWADRYDGEISELFDLQDRVAEAVVGTLHPTILVAEIGRARRKRPENLKAYDLALRAFPHAWALNRQDNEKAMAMLSEAIDLDPGYALTYGIRSWCRAQRIVYNWTPDREGAKGRALADAQRAFELDGRDPLVLTVLATAESLSHELDAALVHVNRALGIDRNHAWGWMRSGWINTFIGTYDVAIPHFERAARLSPYDPLHFNVCFGTAQAHFGQGDYETSVEWVERALLENPKAVWAYRALAASNALLGRDEEAARAMRIFRSHYPEATAASVIASLPLQREDVRRRYTEGLVRAGLPR